MNILEYPIDYYIERMKTGNYFALPGYSDAELYCCIRYCIGVRTGLGQIMTELAGDRLINVLRSRHTDPRFMFAIPKCLWEFEDCITAKIPEKIEALCEREAPSATFVERDMITDDLAKNAGLYPLIKQVRTMHSILIGNKYLSRIQSDLDIHRFIEIPSPNLHLEPDNGLPSIIHNAEILTGKNGWVVLVSAGISAALIIDALYEKHPNNFYVDCGSIWDAFAGIGSQRGWRRELYADPVSLEKWRNKNLNG